MYVYVVWEKNKYAMGFLGKLKSFLTAIFFSSPCTCIGKHQMNGENIFLNKIWRYIINKTSNLIDKFKMKYCSELSHCFSDDRLIPDSIVKHSEQNPIEDT